MSVLLPDVLWEEIQSLLPQRKESPLGGRPPVPDRDCLRGIIFVLKSGVPWNLLPAEMNCGSGVTCWRRFCQWTKVGVWKKLHLRLLRRLGKRGALKMVRAVIDSASVRAVLGGRIPGPIPRTGRKTAANAT
jgi:transposase